ncbi:hypothetical protein M9Y10_004304 [Tritrichomonas musculus]|uniref:Myb-like DNA-binding domain containing protein n=1 Tax=Tritrichomonas musculus TaxID=1915356 RepID=A0ABR2JS06_9EUKA
MSYLIIPQIPLTAIQTSLIRKKFTEKEDSVIVHLVNNYGPKNWDQIALMLPGRTGRQCRDRYFNYLMPGYFYGEWTKEEDILLNKKFNEMGRQWAKMKPFFPGRSAICIKNRWEYFLSKHNQYSNNDNKSKIQEEKHDMSDEIIEYNKQMDLIPPLKTKTIPIHKIKNGINIATQTCESYLLTHKNENM